MRAIIGVLLNLTNDNGMDFQFSYTSVMMISELHTCTMTSVPQVTLTAHMLYFYTVALGSRGNVHSGSADGLVKNV